MKKTTIVILTVSLLIYSCKNTDKQTTHATTGDTTIEKKTNTQGNFYECYEGTIGNKTIVMNVARFQKVIDINYFYTDEGKRILLYQNTDTTLLNDSLFFLEFSRYNGIREDQLQQDAQLHLLLKKDGISGFWISGDQRTVNPVLLKPATNKGSTAFNITGYKDSIIIPIHIDTTSAYSNAFILEPSDIAIQGEWYNKLIMENVLGERRPDTGANLETALQQSAKDFIKGFASDIDTMKINYANDTSFTYSFMHYTNDIVTNALYNDKGYAVLCAYQYNYTGGAHGLNWETPMCLDIQNKTGMALKDILILDSARLQPIVEQAFRKQFNIATGKPLTAILFENHLAPSNNFYFTSKGIGFIYQPYEVAAYVYGIIDVWLPYTDVKAYLNPAFAQRMAL